MCTGSWSEGNMEELNTSQVFCELRSLVIFETPTLSSIIPSNLRLQNLQRIKVRQCDR